MTLPVRGSTSRPAFTRVFEAGTSAAACPATKRKTAKTRKVRIPTGASRFGKKLRAAGSPIAEGNPRIHFHGAARGQITREHCDTDAKESDTDDSRTLCRPYAVEQTCHQGRNAQS